MKAFLLSAAALALSASAGGAAAPAALPDPSPSSGTALSGDAAPSAASPGRFTWEGTPGSVLIGSSFTLQGWIEFPEEYELQGLDREGLETGAFEILGAEAGEREFRDGMERRPVSVVAAAFALGVQTLPPLRWILRPPKSAAPSGAPPAAVSPAATLTVNPPPPGLRDTGDIRDIKGPFSPRLWPWLLALLAALAAAAWGVRRFWLLTRRPAAAGAVPAAPADLRSSEEIALAEIDALVRMGLPVKDHYDRLSDILRVYFERHYGFAALPMTTYDLQRRLLKLQTDPQVRSWIKTLFNRCDLAKFARLLPDDAQIKDDAESARQIVRRLGPAAAVPPEELAAKR